MDKFELKGFEGFIRIEIKEAYGFPKETSHWGGYDTLSEMEINCDGFAVRSTLYTSTGDIFRFYSQLATCHDVVNGVSCFHSYEGNLAFEVRYEINGRVMITGEFSKQNECGNKLIFENKSDQSYLQQALTQLESIIAKYGDMQGVR